MKTISLSSLQTLLAGINHATPVTITTVTETKARRTGNPWRGIWKVCRVNGIVGAVYENSVLRQQGREGVTNPAFEASERQWGTRVSSALVVNGDTYYLAIQPNPTIRVRPLYLVPEIKQGRPRLILIPKEKIAQWLPPDRTAETAEAQGVTRAVIYRNYKLTSIAEIAMGGEKYRVRQTA